MTGRDRWYATRGDFNDRRDLAIVDRSSGEYAGEVMLNDLVPENRSCHFRILLVGDRNRGRVLGIDADTMSILESEWVRHRGYPDR